MREQDADAGPGPGSVSIESARHLTEIFEDLSGSEPAGIRSVGLVPGDGLRFALPHPGHPGPAGQVRAEDHFPPVARSGIDPGALAAYVDAQLPAEAFPPRRRLRRSRRSRGLRASGCRLTTPGVWAVPRPPPRRSRPHPEAVRRGGDLREQLQAMSQLMAKQLDIAPAATVPRSTLARSPPQLAAGSLPSAAAVAVHLPAASAASSDAAGCRRKNSSRSARTSRSRRGRSASSPTTGSLSRRPHRALHHPDGPVQGVSPRAIAGSWPIPAWRPDSARSGRRWSIRS